MSSAVLRPGIFVVTLRKRTAFSITQSAQPVLRNAEIHHVVFCGIRAAFTKSQVIFIRSPFIAVSFNQNRNRAALCVLQYRGVVLQRWDLIEGHCDERGTDEYNLAL